MELTQHPVVWRRFCFSKCQCRFFQQALQGPWDSPKKVPKEDKVSSPVVWGCNCTDHPASSLQDAGHHDLTVTAAKAASSLHISNQALLFCLSCTLFLLGFSTMCIRKVLGVLSRNLPECLYFALWLLQQMSGWLKSHLRTRVCVCGAAFCKRPHLLPLPDQAAFNR